MAYSTHTKTKGVTLIEMLFVIGVFSMIMLGMTVFFTKIWDLNKFSFGTSTATLTASQTVERMVTMTRRAASADNGSFPLVSVNDDEMIFYGDYDNDGVVERVRYFLDGTDLKQGIIEPDYATYPVAYDENSEVVTTLAANLVNTAEGVPVFAYYGETGKIFSFADETTTVLATPANPTDVRMVKISIAAQSAEYTPPRTVLIQSFAVMRNLSPFDEV